MKTPDSSWVPSVLAEYEQALTRYAAHITGDIERAREVVQDTFLKLCARSLTRSATTWRNGFTPFAATGRWMCSERRKG